MSQAKFETQENEHWLTKLLLNRWFYLFLTTTFFFISTLIFIWAREVKFFSSAYRADNSLFGTFGDFFGGVLGTVFTLISLLLLIKTFRHQQQVTLANDKQLTTQRFNDLFFELLHLYQSQIEEFCGQEERLVSPPQPKKKKNAVVEEITYDNKDFFDFEKERMQKEFACRGSYESCKEKAEKYYILFYLEHRSKMAAYFRTLYRIYDLIDHAEITETSKKNYLKIIRAQLTDSELFFLRYNAMTYYGQPFVDYINKYNITKHLPAFELLEFKNWWKKLERPERYGINIVFAQSTRILRRLLLMKNREMVFRPDRAFKNPKYRFSIKTTSDYQVEIQLTIYATRKNKTLEYMGFDHYGTEELRSLLGCFLKEMFTYSNFSCYNLQHIEYDPGTITTVKTVTTIKIGVRNTQQKPLVMKHNFSKSSDTAR